MRWGGRKKQTFSLRQKNKKEKGTSSMLHKQDLPYVGQSGSLLLYRVPPKKNRKGGGGHHFKKSSLT